MGIRTFFPNIHKPVVKCTSMQLQDLIGEPLLTTTVGMAETEGMKVCIYR